MEKMSSLVQCVVTRNTEFIVYFPCGIDPYHAASFQIQNLGYVIRVYHTILEFDMRSPASGIHTPAKV